MRTLLSLPTEILADILERACANEGDGFSSSPFSRAAGQVARNLPLVCRKFDSFYQKYILTVEQGFKKTERAISHAVVNTTNRLADDPFVFYVSDGWPLADATQPLTDDQFEVYVSWLIARNASVSVDFSIMSEKQTEVFLKALNAANKSDTAVKTENLKIKSAQSLPDLTELTHLKSLEVDGCKNIRNLPSVIKPDMLKSLVLKNCDQLPSLDVFSGLGHLEVSCCPGMSGLLLSALKSMHSLKLSFPMPFTEVKPLVLDNGLPIQGVKELVFRDDENTLPSLAGLTSLVSLELNNFDHLHVKDFLPSLVELSALKFVKLIDCSVVGRRKLKQQIPAGVSLEFYDVNSRSSRYATALQELKSLMRVTNS